MAGPYCRDLMFVGLSVWSIFFVKSGKIVKTFVSWYGDIKEEKNLNLQKTLKPAVNIHKRFVVWNKQAQTPLLLGGLDTGRELDFFIFYVTRFMFFLALQPWIKCVVKILKFSSLNGKDDISIKFDFFLKINWVVQYFNRLCRKVHNK